MSTFAKGGGATASSIRYHAKGVFVVGPPTPARVRVAAWLQGVVERVVLRLTLDDVAFGDESLAAAVIVLVPGPTSTPSLVDSIVRYRAHDLASAILLCSGLGDLKPHRLASLARVGVDEWLATDEGDDSGDRIRKEVKRRLLHALPDALVRHAVAGVGEKCSAYVSWRFRCAFQKLLVATAADWFRVDLTTLNRHLRKEGLRSYLRVIECGRLLHVAHWLDSTSVPMAVIARTLGYPTPAAFANDVKRWCGRSPQGLRARGATDDVLLTISKRLHGINDVKMGSPLESENDA